LEVAELATAKGELQVIILERGGRMMRGLIWMLVGVGCLGAAFAAPEQKAGSSPVCLYESKAYSEGAFVCVQKSLILTCVADGPRASWKPVADQDVNERCTAPTVAHTPPEPRTHLHRRHFLVARIRPVVDGSKCFLFIGRQYCE
jgi:hypothetical protein